MNYGLSNETIDKMRRVFKNNLKVNKVIIYGSRVKGNYKQGSDIDLTVVGDSLDLQDILKLMVEMDDLFLPYEVDLSDLSKIDNVELIDHIQRVGKLFYVKSIEKES